jgi:hypothetical protein
MVRIVEIVPVKKKKERFNGINLDRWDQMAKSVAGVFNLINQST